MHFVNCAALAAVISALLYTAFPKVQQNVFLPAYKLTGEKNFPKKQICPKSKFFSLVISRW